MEKAGASNHDKITVVKMYAQRMPTEQIASATGLKMAHVQAIISNYKSGKLKVNVPDRLQYEQDTGTPDPAQAERIDELEAQNAALSSKLDQILARLGGAEETPAEAPRPVAVEVPEMPDDAVEEMAAAAAPEKAEEAPEKEDPAPKDETDAPRRRRRRVANE